MLGTTGGRFQGPSGSQTHRNLWPSSHIGRSLEFQSNGEGKVRFCLSNLKKHIYKKFF